MIGNKKLKKDSKDLYLEPYKDGKDFKWARKLESLWLDLYDVKIVRYASIDSPKFPLTKEYKEGRQRYIQAVGIAEDRSIHLINTEGELGKGHDRIELSIRPYERGAEDKDEDLPYGELFYMDEDVIKYEGRRDPYVCMQLHVSQEIVDGLIDDIEQQLYERIRLMVYVNVFQSEVERGLAEPWMNQDYCIEESGSTGAHFYQLVVDNVATSPHRKVLPKDDIDEWEDEDDWDEPQKQPEPLEEVRDLFADYATTIATHAKGIKVALYWILFVLVIINIPW